MLRGAVVPTLVAGATAGDVGAAVTVNVVVTVLVAVAAVWESPSPPLAKTPMAIITTTIPPTTQGHFFDFLVPSGVGGGAPK